AGSPFAKFSTPEGRLTIVSQSVADSMTKAKRSGWPFSASPVERRSKTAGLRRALRGGKNYGDDQRAARCAGRSIESERQGSQETGRQTRRQGFQETRLLAAGAAVDRQPQVDGAIHRLQKQARPARLDAGEC